MEEYIIINKTVIQQRIEELEVLKGIHCDKGSFPNLEEFTTCLIEQRILKQILSQSTPLISEIEKAFDAGEEFGNSVSSFSYNKQDYISNLKLDI